jgi:cell pole-organizing protein PopZ
MSAYLEITLKIKENKRPAAAEIYTTYRQPFLKEIKGAQTKALLVRDDDVQVLHGFDSLENAQAYLKSRLFNEDVVTKLKPLLEAEPEVRIYNVAG